MLPIYYFKFSKLFNQNELNGLNMHSANERDWHLMKKSLSLDHNKTIVYLPIQKFPSYNSYNKY